jgi:tripartite-type tricarboxylate transporter receptor subunit TctC
MRFKILAGFLLGLLSMAAQAQGSYPQRPIKLVVGFVAGGVSDVMARILAPELQKALGQPVVVENKPGAARITWPNLPPMDTPCTWHPTRI